MCRGCRRHSGCGSRCCWQLLGLSARASDDGPPSWQVQTVDVASSPMPCWLAAETAPTSGGASARAACCCATLMIATHCCVWRCASVIMCSAEGHMVPRYCVLISTSGAGKAGTFPTFSSLGFQSKTSGQLDWCVCRRCRRAQHSLPCLDGLAGGRPASNCGLWLARHGRGARLRQVRGERLSEMSRSTAEMAFCTCLLKT